MLIKYLQEGKKTNKTIHFLKKINKNLITIYCLSEPRRFNPGIKHGSALTDVV
jgi:hypothetical protein